MTGKSPEKFKHNKGKAFWEMKFVHPFINPSICKAYEHSNLKALNIFSELLNKALVRIRS